jgi:hypothetical protein
MVYPGDIEYCLDCNKKADEHDLKGLKYKGRAFDDC